MNETDRAIVAAAEERADTQHMSSSAAFRDRRELLRIVRALEAAIDKFPVPRALDSAAVDGAKDRADAAAEAEFLRPIGGGL